MNANYIVVFVTVKDKAEAEKISRALLEKKQAACVNIAAGIDSFFWWEGTVDRASESMLIIKTKKQVFDQLVETVKGLHSYSVPEIIAMPVICGQVDYLSWIDETVSW